MRVLLVNPPKEVYFQRTPYMRWFPLGIAYIAGALRAQAIQVSIFDAMAFPEDNFALDDNAFEVFRDRPGVSSAFHIGASWERLANFIASAKPDVVGISCLMAAHRREAIQVASLAKSILGGQVSTVVGGSDADREPHGFLIHQDIDYVVTRPAENNFVALVRALSEGVPVQDLPGIVHRGKRSAGTVVSNSDGLQRLRLHPAIDLLPLERWFTAAGNRFAMIVTSRGCPAPCTFCSQRRTPHVREPLHFIIEEVQEATRRHGVDTLLVEDDMLLFNRASALDLFEALSSLPQRYRIHCLAGVSPASFDAEMAHVMSRAGVVTLPFSFETSNDAAREQTLRKGFVTRKKLVQAIVAARNAGIPDVRVFLIAGLPGTTMDDCLDDIDYVFRLGLRANLNGYYPIPGTPLFDECVANGYLVSHDPTHHRGAYGNIHTPDFHREDLLCLLDSYHALKILSGYPSLSECLIAHGVTPTITDVFTSAVVAVRECECSFVPRTRGVAGRLHCRHFAGRLATWLSLASTTMYGATEIECRLAGDCDQCRFAVTQVTPSNRERRIIERLRSSYNAYKNVVAVGTHQ